MVYETKCKRCGETVCFLSPARWSYKIDDWIFCSYHCKNEELKKQEEDNRKKEEALERARLQRNERRRNARRQKRYMFDKDNPKPPKENTGGKGNRRAVLKIRVSDGEVVQRFATLGEAACAEGISKGTMSQRANGHSVRVKEFIWKYEDEV